MIIPRILPAVLALAATTFASAEQTKTPSTTATLAPAPYGAVPSPRQLAWHEMEMYAFIHFTINTFTDKEWGYGDESPQLFNPTDFDSEQIVSTLADAEMSAIILTSKHHDGFCLWPTATTDHNISASPFQNGQGDIVGAIEQSARQHNLDFGIYVSPWDRNNTHYGDQKYVQDVFRAQIKELLTNYGEIVEVWFDGANGGDGYYAGANETREIDRTTYYDWPTTWQMVRDLAPLANIFSDVGPDIRWVGNERGHAPHTSWATFDPLPLLGETKTGPGFLKSENLGTGTRHGTQWIPAEVDVSIRPGWFWHANQNDKVRQPDNLMKIYLESVGRGANLLLNVPPDRTGQIHPNDAASLHTFGEHLRATFAKNLASDARLEASAIRGEDSERFGPQHLVDEDRWSAWTTGDFETTPEVILTLPETRAFNLIRLREDIRLGQRVAGVSIDVEKDGQWQEIAKAQSIGASRLWRVPMQNAQRIRIRVTNSPVCPALSDFGLFLEPEIAGQPQAKIAHLPRDNWKITSSYQATDNAVMLLDGDPKTLWHTHSATQGESGLPQFVTINLGQTTEFSAVSVLPRQDSTTSGMVDRYRLETSVDGQTWHEVAAGEFSNVAANPVAQTITLREPAKAQYLRLHALHAMDGNHAALAEINLLP